MKVLGTQNLNFSAYTPSLPHVRGGWPKGPLVLSAIPKGLPMGGAWGLGGGQV